MNKACAAIVLSTTLILGACSNMRTVVIQPEKRDIPVPDFIMPDSGEAMDRLTSEKAAANNEVGRSVNSNHSEIPSDVIPNPINFEIVSESFPAELEPLLEENRKETGYLVRKIDDAWYVAVFMGEQKTGGYELTIDVIETCEGETVIKLTEVAPSEDDMVLMAITHPFQVIRMTGSIVPDFEVINQEGERYPEMDLLVQ